MLALLGKEIKTFLSSLTGYIVIAVFLTSIGLFAWIFPGNNNILESGYAQLDTLFFIAPWVFMFLIPAITMRSFSEEQKTGTIELLLTRPLSDFQIVFAKYLAGLLLVILALIPTLIYYYTIYQLASPIGNVDSGGILGSYIGLLLLGATFVSIGIFSSSLTSNQIIAFVIAIFISFFCYIGFNSIASISLFEGFNNIIKGLGIHQHYLSISRGVIDTRDIIYYLSINAVFILITKIKLNSRSW